MAAIARIHSTPVGASFSLPATRVSGNRMTGGERFALGTFSAAGGPEFPGMVLGDEVFALRAIDQRLRAQGKALRGADWGGMDSCDGCHPPR